MSATNSDQILEAKESFATEIDGKPVTVMAGQTRVRSGHPLHRARPDAWKPLEVQPDAAKGPTAAPPAVEQATAAPGEKRGAPAAH